MIATGPHVGKTYDDLAIGDEASTTRLVTPDDRYGFAHVSGNFNPLNLPSGGSGNGAAAPAPAMSVALSFSAVLRNLIPGPGASCEAQTLRFYGRAVVGDSLTVSVPHASRPLVERWSQPAAIAS
jgi:phosphate butyryltransferase